MPAKTKAAKDRDAKVVQLPAINLQTIKVTVVGETPLIMNKKPQSLIDGLRGKITGQPNKARGTRDPHEEFLGSIHYICRNGKPGSKKKERYGVPPSAFKHAMVSAGIRFCGMDKKGPSIYGAIRIKAEMSEDGHPLVEIKGTPKMREDLTRVGNGLPNLAWRAEFWPWSMDLEITFDASFISEDNVLNLLYRAGQQVGICDWRIEKKAGEFGRFRIQTEKPRRKRVK